MSTREERQRESDEQNRLIARWECVHFVDTEVRLAQITRTHGSGNIRRYDLDASEIHGKNALVYAIESLFDWRAMFGYTPSPEHTSWDAFLSGLCEIDSIIPDVDGYLLVLSNTKHLWVEEPIVPGTLVEVWLAAAGRREHYSTRTFNLVFVL